MARTTRMALGLAALALVGTGGWWLMVDPGERAGGILLRAGLMTGAAWLVAPVVRRPSLATIAWGAAFMIMLLRPRFIIAVVVAAVIWRLSSRQNETAR